MINKFINSLLMRRHFWRYASFSEVAELYMSRLIRIFALHMVSLFIGIYLYRLGYSLPFVMFFTAAYYGLKVFITPLVAIYVARFGAKHTILLGNLCYIPALLLFNMVPSPDSSQWFFNLAAFTVFYAIGATAYDYAYMVNFSKVKSSRHAGKEIGYMYIIEKSASIVSPVVGGFIASFLGAHIVIGVAGALFALAAVPLLRSGEVVRTRQKIRWKGFPWRTTWRSAVAYSGVGFDVVTSGVGWSLFLMTMVFAAQGEQIYAILGVLSAIGMVMAFVAAFVFGRLIDRAKGRYLLYYGVLAKSLCHLARPLIGGSLQAGALNAGSEISTTSYSMAFVRGIFDTADYSGFRLTYLLLVEVTVNCGACLSALIGGVLLSYLEPQYGFSLFFALSAIAILIIATPRFAIYKK